MKRIYSLGGLLQHVVTVPARDGDESDGLRVVADLLDEGGRLLDNFVEAILRPLYSSQYQWGLWIMTGKAYLGGIHLVDGDNELTHTEGVGEQSVLTSLAILGDTSLELTSTGSDNEDSAIGLGGTSNHVLDI